MIDFIDWRITKKCNMSCEYCYAKKTIYDICFSKKKVIADKIIKYGCQSVCITGGEPLIIDSEVIPIIELLVKNSVNVYLSTNGTNYLKNSPYLHRLISRLSLPLDGYDKVSNTLNGRDISSFELTKAVLQFINTQNINPYIKVNTTITKKNSSLNLLLAIYDMLCMYNINKWEIYEFIPENQGIKNYNQLYMATSEFHNLKNSFKKIVVNPPFTIEFSERDSRNSVYIIIQPDGTVMIPVKNINIVNERIVGNLNHESLSDIERRISEYVSNINDFSKGRIVK